MNRDRLLIIASLAVVLVLAFGCEPRQSAQLPNETIAEPPLLSPKPKSEPNITTIPAVPEPQPKPQPKPKPQPPSAEQFNMSLSNIFKSVVDDAGLVDYAKLRRMKIQLNTAINSFAKLKAAEFAEWPQKTRTAFWINAYNIFTLKVVSDNYPIKASRYMRIFYPSGSAKHISGLWTKHYLNVMQIQYALHEIERKAMNTSNDPRIHFALCYASLSSAPLRNKPYLGLILDNQLDDQAKNFLAKPKNFEIDKKNQVVYLSKIFAMNTADFLKKYNTNKILRQYPPDERAILNCIINYISPEDAAFIKKTNCSIEYIKYDWHLNAQKKSSVN